MVLRCGWALIALMILLFCIPSVRAEDGAKFDKHKVLAEWTALAKKILSMRYEMVRESYSSSDGKPLQFVRKDIMRFAFSSAGQSLNYESERYDDKETVKERETSLEIANRLYKANLKKPKEKSEWVLFQLKLLSNADNDRPFRPTFVFPWLMCGNLSLPDWVADNSFVIKKTETIRKADTGDLLRVHFVHDKTRKQSSEVPDHIPSGFIDFDPAHFYRPMRYQYHHKEKVSQGLVHGVLEYDLVGGIPVLKTMTRESPEMDIVGFGVRSSKEIRIYKIEYQAWVSDEEFRLSYYGLPEPQGVVWPTRSRWYLWFFGAGIIALLVGAFFRYRIQRCKNLLAQGSA